MKKNLTIRALKDYWLSDKVQKLLQLELGVKYLHEYLDMPSTRSDQRVLDILVKICNEELPDRKTGNRSRLEFIEIPVGTKYTVVYEESQDYVEPVLRFENEYIWHIARGNKK